MALMINIGVAGAWKVRAQVATRYAGWSTVAERTRQSNPPPDNWPRNALLEGVDGTNLPEVDQLWNSHQDLLAEAIRGPTLTSPNQTVPVPVERRLEMDAEVQRGHGHLDRPLPLLRGATTNGRFSYDLNQDLFDNRWQFFTMGFSHNEAMRALQWYFIEHDELAQLDPRIQNTWQEVQRTAQRIRTNPMKCHLYALDRDREFQIYYGSAPDFYPRARGCSMIVDDVRERIVARLINDIDRLPRTISLRFGNMYNTWLCELEVCGGPKSDLQMKYDGLRPLNGMPRREVCVCRSAPCPTCPPLPGPDNCTP